MASVNQSSSATNITQSPDVTNSLVHVASLMEVDKIKDGDEKRSTTTTTGEVSNPSVIPMAVMTDEHGGISSENVGGGSGSGSGTKVVAIKNCIGRSNRGISWSTMWHQGMRKHMEDRLMTIKTFMSMRCNDFGGCNSPDCRYAAADSRIHYFGLFDGHGGDQVSDYCARTLHDIIAQEWGSESGVDEWNMKWEITLSKAYERVDDACKERQLALAGSTAVVVLLSPCQIIAANCGDSRAVLVRKTETIPLTNDHKPNRTEEVQRIVKEGGCIVEVRGVLRVGGVLAMTRAIGDQYLKPWVSSVPEISFTSRSEQDECLIIASDGVWDVMTTDWLGTFARELIRRKRREGLSDGTSSISVANLIVTEALKKSSTDNISAIVIDLKPLRKQRSVQP